MTRPHEQSTLQHTGAGETAALPPLERPDEHGGGWLDGAPQLPGRPRLRLLNPLSALLAAALVGAGGFLVGVLVEKGQGSSGESASGSGAAARLQALRGAAGQGGAAGGSPTGAGRFGAPGAATVGQVAFVRGATLYVTELEGNTVKVTTSGASTITRSVKASVKGIHPGETVIVSGTPNAGGAISAQSIRIGSGLGVGARGGGGGLAALLSGAGAGAAARSTGAGAKGGAPGEAGGAPGEPQLFGSGR